MAMGWERLGQIVDAAERDGVAERFGVAVRARVADGTTTTWDRHGAESFMSASTIKVAILIAVARAIDEGRLRHDERRSARPVDTIIGSGVLKGMEAGLSLTIDDHAYLMVAISDNTASNVLIEAAGLGAVQAVTAGYGFTGTHLRRPFLGVLPSDDLPRNMMTASDLVTMLASIADGEAASPESCEWMMRLLREQQHVDRLGRALPDDVTFAGKSGSLEGTVHDGAILAGPNGQVVIAVLTRGVTDSYAADAVLGRLSSTVVELAGISGQPG